MIFIHQTLFTSGALFNWATQEFANNVSFNENEIFTYFRRLQDSNTNKNQSNLKEGLSLLNPSKFKWNLNLECLYH